MTVEQQPRFLERVIPDIAKELGAEYVSLCEGWVHMLSLHTVKTYIYGYQFGLNGAAAQLIARDKVATSSVLRAAGLPCLPHSLVQQPRPDSIQEEAEFWDNLKEIFTQSPAGLVWKPIGGAGGKNIYHVPDVVVLQNMFPLFWKERKRWAVSPYRNIKNEFRLVMLNGACVLVYKKERPIIIGTGQNTVAELLSRYAAEKNLSELVTQRLIEHGTVQRYGKEILQPGERLLIHWQHNLGQGAFPVLCAESEEAEKIALACQVMAVTGLRFASVDIIDSDQGIEIIEINSGVMLEGFAATSAVYATRAREVYSQAIRAALLYT